MGVELSVPIFPPIFPCHLEIAVWDWVPETAELELIFSINDEVDWNSNEKRTLPELKAALTKAFAQLASLPIKT
jgi:hypothetical protein